MFSNPRNANGTRPLILHKPASIRASVPHNNTAGTIARIAHNGVGDGSCTLILLAHSPVIHAFRGDAPVLRLSLPGDAVDFHVTPTGEAQDFRNDTLMNFSTSLEAWPDTGRQAA